jgi:hypothetical protein
LILIWCFRLRSVGEACTNSAGGKSMAKTCESIVGGVLEFSIVHWARSSTTSTDILAVQLDFDRHIVQGNAWVVGGCITRASRNWACLRAVAYGPQIVPRTDGQSGRSWMEFSLLAS